MPLVIRLSCPSRPGLCGCSSRITQMWRFLLQSKTRALLRGAHKPRVSASELSSARARAHKFWAQVQSPSALHLHAAADAVGSMITLQSPSRAAFDLQSAALQQRARARAICLRIT